MGIWKLCRKLRIYLYRHKIKHKAEVSIICNNCLGGVLYHDLGMRFNSPFINIMIPTPQFIDLLTNIASIDFFDLKEVTPHKHCYPIGLLYSRYELHFMHEPNFDIAKSKWIERAKRINFNNLFLILVETHSSSYQDLIDFNGLPFTNKIIITHKEYPEIGSAVSIKEYDGKNLNGEILWPMNRWGKTKYDQVDWLTFLKLR